MVRATEPAGGGNSEVVYSNSQGRFTLKTSLQGKLSVRLRAPYYQDVQDSIDFEFRRFAERESMPSNP